MLGACVARAVSTTRRSARPRRPLTMSARLTGDAQVTKSHSRFVNGRASGRPFARDAFVGAWRECLDAVIATIACLLSKTVLSSCLL